MKTVRVKKTDLLKTLHENKETHIDDFDIAWEAFVVKAKENFEERLKQLQDLKKGMKVNLNVNIQMPVNYSSEYDRAIQMLEWELEDTIELEEDEFQRLVMDDWGWKGQFSALNTMYTGSASPSKL